MGETTMQHVLDNIRPALTYNVSFVEQYFKGRGIDMGCGNCPLQWDDCLHVDQSPQPLAVHQVGKEKFLQADCVSLYQTKKVDFIFSSHMVEDLANEDEMVLCLRNWADLVRPNGYVIILIPDIEGGRYFAIDDPNGNPSHRVAVGKGFFLKIYPRLSDMLELVQIDTIPHEKSNTMDIVYKVLF